VANAKGEHEIFHYDADHRVVEARTPDERLIRVDYGELGVSGIEIRSASAPNGSGALSRVQMDLDTAGRLLRAVSGGQERRFEYNDRGFLVFAATGEISVERSYDVSGRCVDETVDLIGGPASAPSKYPAHVRREFDALGRKVRIQCNGTVNVALGWDENSRVTSVEVGDTTVRYSRDASGAEVERSSHGMRLGIKRDFQGREVEWLYDIAGQAPVRIQNSYDSRGFLSFLGVAMAQMQVSAIVRCDGRGRIRALVQQGEGRRSRFFDYDGEGHWLLHARAGRGEEILHVLENGAWDRMAIVVPHHADETARATLQAGGRLDHIRSGAVTIRYKWDSLGRAVEKIVRTGDQEDAWRFEYDAWEALVAVHSPHGASFRYRYDALGRCVDRTSGDGRITRFIWDDRHLMHILVNGELVETRVHSEDTGDLLVQRFVDGSFDVRPNRLREIEDQLGSASSGSSIEPGEAVPRVGPATSLSQLPAMGSSFYDLETRLLIGISRCCDIETGYHLTWQRGDHPYIPWPSLAAPANGVEDLEPMLVRGMDDTPDHEPNAEPTFLSPQARAIATRAEPEPPSSAERHRTSATLSSTLSRSSSK